jgi:23S rRNA U2552 (ribose-2'-O)-methylase RlmE/FtsJ
MRDPERAHSIAMEAVYRHYALQKVHELNFMLALLEKDDIVVEIGCDAGGTSWAIKEMGVGLHIGIDLPGDNFSSGLAWMGDQSAHMIWGDSHKKETRARLDEMLDGAQIDVLIIDGDHTYPGVSDDFRMYSKLVSGLVIFHDICEHQQPKVQVDKFYKEVSKRYPHTEYIDLNDTSWGGIGVLDLSFSNRLTNACT